MLASEPVLMQWLAFCALGNPHIIICATQRRCCCLVEIWAAKFLEVAKRAYTGHEHNFAVWQPKNVQIRGAREVLSFVKIPIDYH